MTVNTAAAKDGFEGILFPGNGRKDKVMIVMSGSNGGMKMARREAQFYDRNGFPALALALFRTKQTSKDLVRVPVEYVERAVQYLKDLGYRKIGVDGTSKGSEMALLAGSLLSDLSCVIARVPSHFVSEGLCGEGTHKGPSGTSCSSFRGKEVPYAPYRTRTINILKILKEEKELRLLQVNSDKDLTPETIIPVERIHGPVLLISSRQDAVWPSYASACIIEDQLDSVSFPYPHRHIAFEHMSHAAITHLPWVYKQAFRAEREHPDECAEDRETMKRELLHWVKIIW